ncbi:MAG: hypothetical protein EOO24_30185, partial [Comamonadaceae bacterium]
QAHQEVDDLEGDEGNHAGPDDREDHALELDPDLAAHAEGIGGQVWIQFKSVIFTIVWSGVVSFIAFKIVDLLVGLRVTEEEEREGLDISSHGETAYHR